MWTERFGDRDDPSVLLVMGTSTQAIGRPDDLVASLVRSGRQVIRFDHRDTGRSDCVDFSANPYTLADMAADTLAVLDGHDIDRTHVVGLPHRRPHGRAVDRSTRPGGSQSWRTKPSS